MYATLKNFEPKTRTESAFYGQALSRLDDIVTERKNTLATITETEQCRLVGAMDARTVARDGYRGLMAGRPVVISGLRNWLVAESVRFAPRRTVTAISRWIAEKVE